MSIHLLWLQAATAPAVNLPEKADEGLSLLDLLLKGGVVMIPLVILSIITVYLIIERAIAISNAAKIDPNLLNTVKSYLQNGKVNEARQYCEQTQTSMGRILSNGINYLGQKFSDVEAALEESTNVEVARMEQRLNYLGLIAGIAPMLGFVGTISGIIRIFYNISVSDNISIGIIAGGLYEKMITSGAGLIVGIIAYSGFHLLQSRIDKFVLRVQETVMKFKAILYQKV